MSYARYEHILADALEAERTAKEEAAGLSSSVGIMGRFDEVLGDLGCDLADMRACVGPPQCQDHSARISEYEAAIRVLEAAEKVDRDELAWTMGFIKGRYPKTVYALLAALPDDDTDKKGDKNER